MNPQILVGKTKFFISFILRQDVSNVQKVAEKLLLIESCGQISTERSSRAALLRMRSTKSVSDTPIRLILHASPYANEIFEYLLTIADADKNDSFLVCFSEDEKESRGSGRYASLVHSTALKYPAESIQSNIVYTYDPDNSVRIEKNETEPAGFEDVVLPYLIPAIQMMYPRP